MTLVSFHCRKSISLLLLWKCCDIYFNSENISCQYRLSQFENILHPCNICGILGLWNWQMIIDLYVCQILTLEWQGRADFLHYLSSLGVAYTCICLCKVIKGSFIWNCSTNHELLIFIQGKIVGHAMTLVFPSVTIVVQHCNLKLHVASPDLSGLLLKLHVVK